MNRKDRIRDLYTLTPQGGELAAANSLEDQAPQPPANRVPAGPIRTMGLALDRIESESHALRDALAAGLSVVDLAPDRIEASFVRDRLPEDEAEFAVFRQSIADGGQEVPILVRPHPDRDGVFQIAFGHRRHRACASLGIKVKAIVRRLTDRELVVAQGVENAQRRDLSYIERALYAARLEDRGFERTVICDALATEKGELSKLISVAREVPEEIISAIGPAPKTGRRRWMSLAEALMDAGARKLALRTIRDPNLEKADSDTRFIRVLAVLAPAPKDKARTVWTGMEGQKSATLTRTSRHVSLAFEAHVEPEFAEYVAGRLDELYASFRQAQT